MLSTGSTAKVRSAWRKVGTPPPILPTYLSHATRTAAAGDTPTLHHCWELSQPRAFLDGPLAPLLRTPPTSRHFLRTMDILSHCRQHEFRMSNPPVCPMLSLVLSLVFFPLFQRQGGAPKPPGFHTSPRAQTRTCVCPDFQKHHQNSTKRPQEREERNAICGLKLKGGPGGRPG